MFLRHVYPDFIDFLERETNNRAAFSFKAKLFRLTRYFFAKRAAFPMKRMKSRCDVAKGLSHRCRGKCDKKCDKKCGKKTGDAAFLT